MAESERLEFRISRELLDRIDAARGNLPRAAWVKSCIVAALLDESVRVSGASSDPSSLPSVDEAEPTTWGQASP